MTPGSVHRGATARRRRSLGSRALIGLSVLLASGAALARLRGWPDHAPPNVLLIAVDALRPDHLGAYGYGRAISPSIDGLAQQGTLFTEAISQGTWTLPSVTALFLSQYDSTHGVNAPHDRIPDEAETLAEIFRAHGYDTGAATIGAYTSLEFGMGQGFDTFVSEPADAAPRVTWIEEWIGARRKPFFIYAHFVDVHYPYRGQNPYGDNFGGDYRGIVDGQQRLGPIASALQDDDRRHLVDLYDNGVAYADFHLGKLFAWLRDRGLDRNTLVIVTADHGEAFQEHDQMLGHRGCPYDELIRVPLILRGPGVPAAKRISVPVEHIDLAPTLLDLCGFKPGESMQGRSLLPLLRGATTHKAYTFSEYLPADERTIRGDGWKLITNCKGRAQQLFEVGDVHELHDLAAEKPEVVQRMLSQLELFSSANLAARKHEHGAVAELQPQTHEQLRALGYEH